MCGFRSEGETLVSVFTFFWLQMMFFFFHLHDHFDQLLQILLFGKENSAVGAFCLCSVRLGVLVRLHSVARMA